MPSLLLPKKINSPFDRRLVEQISPALVHLFQEESAAGPGDAVLQRSAQVPAACPPMAQNCNETAQV